MKKINNSPTIGVYLGKFLPFHKGHELCIRTASLLVDKLIIIIDNVEEGFSEDVHISGKTRKKRITETFPDKEVIYLEHKTLQDPTLGEKFRTHRKMNLEKCSSKIDKIFAGSMYGSNLAKLVGAEFIPLYTGFLPGALNESYIPLDDKSYGRPVSATSIREDLNSTYKHLPSSTKKDFTLRITICGPESAGKSTLSKKLAKTYGTNWCPEYARTYLESKIKKEDDITTNDLLCIANGQVALSKSLMYESQKIQFDDTDALSTHLRHKKLLGHSCDIIKEVGINYISDFYLLLSPDLPYEPDSIRYHPNKQERIDFFEEYKCLLETHNLPYKIISGTGEKRNQEAISLVDSFIESHFKYEYFVSKLASSSK